MTKIKPLNEKILVKVDNSNNVTATGLIIPDNAKEKATKGIVESVSEDCKIPVKEGMVVLFGKYSGNTVGEDENLLILDSVDIIGYEYEQSEE